MPQMEPLSWMTLFISFSTMLLFSMNKIYFNKFVNLNSKANNTNIITKKNSWKW